MESKKGFTLIELLVVTSIIALLSSIGILAVSSARQNALLARVKAEFKSIHAALEIYRLYNENYPPDAARGVAPTGLGIYLSNGIWPEGPFPQSSYDWDNWVDPENPNRKIYQLSIRFCPEGGSLVDCSFPTFSWAEDFNVNSAAYYCIEGSCRSHNSEPISYPGYCVNCAD